MHLDTLFSLKHIAFLYLTELLYEGIYEKFAKALLDAVQSMKVGDGFSEGVVQVVIYLFIFWILTSLPLHCSHSYIIFTNLDFWVLLDMIFLYNIPIPYVLSVTTI